MTNIRCSEIINKSFDIIRYLFLMAIFPSILSFDKNFIEVFRQEWVYQRGNALGLEKK